MIPGILILAGYEATLNILKRDLLSEKNLEKSFYDIQCDYQWVKKVEHPNKVLLLGSSSVRYGLSCTILDSLSADSLCFLNLAMDSRDPIATYFLLKRMDLKNVKSVYFGIDPWIYTKRYYRYRTHLLYADFNTLQAIRYFKDQDKSVFKTRYSNFIEHFKESIEYKCKDTNQEIPIDFGSVKLERKAKNFDVPINQWFQIEEYGWSTLQFEYLQKLVSLCKKNNISFTAFIPPKRSDFCKAYKDHCSETHKSFIQNLKEAHFDSPIIGSFNQLTPLGDTVLFIEAYHLNELGQRLYSAEFYKMIMDKNNPSASNRQWLN